MPGLAPAAIDMFDSGQLILDAAAQGLGVAFMFEMHLEGAHDPRLARLFGVSAESAYVYWFACRRSALSRRPVRLFHDWLIGTLRETLALDRADDPAHRRAGQEAANWPWPCGQPGITTALLRSRPLRPGANDARRVG